MWIFLVIPLFLTGSVMDLVGYFCQYLTTSGMVMENCENGIDDDGNGLIDLNDPRCVCEISRPVSMIPNPSFEDMKCCPRDRSQLNCAVGWIQASEATTDYVHMCGWFGWPDLPPPRPLPDGEACVGFRNGRFGMNDDPGWKEYAGACLLRPLEAGKTYKFQFDIGFINEIASPPLQVTFFGTPSCDNLPFGIGNQSFGCPTNGPGWLWLESVHASGLNQWVRKTITIKPTLDIYAIAIGPDCANASADGSLYYFFDNLILADEKDFAFVISPQGHPCDPAFSLSVPTSLSSHYQWYKNGVALVGETEAALKSVPGTGRYQVRIQTPTGCKLTEPFGHFVPSFGFTDVQRICSNASYQFKNKTLTESGVYREVFKNNEQCDSLVELHLEVEKNPVGYTAAKIFPGEKLKLQRFSYAEEGVYTVPLVSQIGCDSTVILDLSFFKVHIPNIFSPNGDGVNDVFEIHGGTDLQAVNLLEVYDRWGNRVFKGQNRSQSDGELWNGTSRGTINAEGVYVYLARLLMSDGIERQVQGEVLLMR